MTKNLLKETSVKTSMNEVKQVHKIRLKIAEKLTKGFLKNTTVKTFLKKN